MKTQLDHLNKSLTALHEAKTEICKATDDMHGSEYDAHMCHLAQATADAVCAIGGALLAHLEKQHGMAVTSAV